jgi:hypothetical protein
LNIRPALALAVGQTAVKTPFALSLSDLEQQPVPTLAQMNWDKVLTRHGNTKDIVIVYLFAVEPDLNSVVTAQL